MTSVAERELQAELSPVADARQARGVVADAGEQAIVQRTPAEYKALWQEVYDASLTKGRGENLARHDANARLMRLRTQDEGRPVLGSGDIESYF